MSKNQTPPPRDWGHSVEAEGRPRFRRQLTQAQLEDKLRYVPVHQRQQNMQPFLWQFLYEQTPEGELPSNSPILIGMYQFPERHDPKLDAKFETAYRNLVSSHCMDVKRADKYNRRKIRMGAGTVTGQSHDGNSAIVMLREPDEVMRYVNHFYEVVDRHATKQQSAGAKILGIMHEGKFLPDPDHKSTVEALQQIGALQKVSYEDLKKRRDAMTPHENVDLPSHEYNVICKKMAEQEKLFRCVDHITHGGLVVELIPTTPFLTNAVNTATTWTTPDSDITPQDSSRLAANGMPETVTFTGQYRADDESTRALQTTISAFRALGILRHRDARVVQQPKMGQNSLSVTVNPRQWDFSGLFPLAGRDRSDRAKAQQEYADRYKTAVDSKKPTHFQDGLPIEGDSFNRYTDLVTTPQTPYTGLE